MNYLNEKYKFNGCSFNILLNLNKDMYLKDFTIYNIPNINSKGEFLIKNKYRINYNRNNILNSLGKK